MHENVDIYHSHHDLKNLYKDNNNRNTWKIPDFLFS